MPILSRSLRQITILLFALVLLIGFQNCEQPNWFSPSPNSEKISSGNSISGGNGGGYDGKIETTFYRFIPNFKCASQTGQFYNKIVLNPEAAILVDQSHCQPTQEQIVFGDIQFSLNDAHLAGYKQNIFIHSNNVTQPDQNTYVEAWCFDPSDKKRELILKYNDKTQSATGVLYERDLAPVNLGAISRILSNTKATFKSEQIELSIDKNLKDENLLYITNLTKNFSATKNPMLCRLGGYLDSSLWPAQNLGEGPELLLTSDKTIAFQIQNSSPGSSNQLVQIDLGSKKSHILIESSQGHFGIRKIKISKDEKFLVFISDTTTRPHVYNLYSFSLKDHSIKMLSSGIEKFQQSVFDFKISPDGHWVFFTDAKDFDISTNAYQLTLRKSPVDGSQPMTSISDHPPQFAPGQRISLPIETSDLTRTITDANLLKKNLLYYFQISDSVLMAYDLWSYDISQNKKQLLFKSNPERMLLLSSILSQSPVSSSLFFITYDRTLQPKVTALLSGEAITFENITNLLSSYYDPNSKTWVLLTDYDNSREVGQFSVLNENLIILRSTNFKRSFVVNPRNNNLLFIDENNKVIQYTLSSNLSEELCPGLDSFLNFSLAPQGDIYLLRNEELQTQVVKSTGVDQCSLINSLPHKIDTTGNLTLSPDLNSLVLSAGKFSLTGSADSIIWIPLHGLSPVRVDTSETPGKTWNIFFNEKSSQLFYFGLGKNMTESILFSWSLPK